MDPDDAKDPDSVWDLVKTFMNNSKLPQPEVVDPYLANVASLFKSFPQILVSTDKWPDTDQALARKRRGFSLAVLRRVVNIAAQRSAEREQVSEVEAAVSLLAVLEDREPQTWRRVLLQLLSFWERLNEDSRRDLQSPGISQNCEIFLSETAEEEEEEDESFNKVPNTVKLADFTVTERLQALMSRIIIKQLKFSLDPVTMATIHSLALHQLELGGCELKSVSLELLTSLHQRGGLGVSCVWGEECGLVVSLLHLFSSPDLRPREVDTLSSSLILYLTSTLALMERDHILILSIPLIPFWQSESNLASLSPKLRQQISLTMQKVVEHHEDSDTLREMTAASTEPDFELLAVIAIKELLQCKTFTDSKKEDRLTVTSLSPSWNLIVETFKGKLSNFSELRRLSDVLRKILIAVVKRKPDAQVEFLTKPLMETVTEHICSRLVTGESVSDSLDCLQVLLQCGHLLLGDSQLSSLQQSWAAILTIPWPSLVQAGKQSDLNIKADLRAVLANNGNDVDWRPEDINTALRLLVCLPASVCPRHRLSVLRLAWHNTPLGVVHSLPSVTALSNSGSDFAKEVVRAITGRVEQMEVVLSLANICTPYICSLARRTVTDLVCPAEGELEFCVRCVDCSPSPHDTLTSTSSTVASRDLEDLLRLVGHQDSRVRLNLVKMIPAAAAHCVLTPEAVNLWMTSVLDEDSKVRFAFAHRVGYIVSARRDTLSEGLDQVIITGLQELLPNTSDDSLDSYIISLTTVSRALSGNEAKVKVLNLLLELYITQASTVQTSANALPVLREALKTHKRHVLAWSARCMCSGKYEPQLVLEHLLLLIMGDNKRFLKYNVQHILPSIILSYDGEDVSLIDSALQTISSETGESPMLMLLYKFPEIYQNIVVQASDQKHLQNCIQYLEIKTGQKLANLFSSNRQVTLVGLIKMFESNKERILQGLGRCAMIDQTFQHKEKKAGNLSRPAVLQYLVESLPAVLASFITSCSNPQARPADNLQCLRSLDQLMKHINFESLKSCKYALMDCMKLATNLSKSNKMFEDIAITLWKTFLEKFEMSALVGDLPQIMCRILPHLHTNTTETLEMFTYLLNDNEEEIKSHHNHLMFLRRIPELSDLLTNVLGRELELRETLEGLVLCLESASVDVRLQTLSTLSIVLEENTGGVQGLVVCSDRTDPLVTKLVTGLMRATSSREPDLEVRYLSSLCLGKLGPVDPGRLETVVGVGKSEEEEDVASRNKLLDVFSVGFCVELLQELVRAHASAREPVSAENCSYSMQEILKVYNINFESKNPEDFSYRVWRQFSDVTQEKLTPLFTSKYTYTPSKRASLTSPLYLSEQGRTFHDWLTNWATALVGLLSDRRKKKLFEVCLAALKKDLTIGDLLLPRIVTEVLCDCKPESNQMIMTEINSIIENINVTEPEEKDLQHSVAATLFLVQDHIRLWMRTKFSSLMASTRKTESQRKPEDIKNALTKSKEYMNVTDFVNRISNENLANFCYDVGAYSRSAFHFDLYMKQNKESQSDSSCLASLQRLYVALEEPNLASDLVKGVAAMREDPSLREQVELHQATGNYPDALACLQLMKPEESVLHTVDLIQCYLDMDQPNTASVLAARLSREQPDVAGDLAGLQTEAAWQLGQWEELEAVTGSATSTSSTSTWQIGLGKVLLSMKKEDWADMKGQMKQLRQDVVRSITVSGALEHGAYQTSYRSVNQLGMLNEVQLIADKFLACSTRRLSSPSLASSEVLSELKTRLSFTQSCWSVMEPVLRLRRCCLALAEDRVRPYNSGLADRLHYEVGECWLQSAQLARKSGLLQQSYSLLMEAKQFQNNQQFLEAAKLHWDRDQKTEAIKRLNKGLTDNFPTIEAALLQDRSKDSLERALSPLTNSEKEILCRAKVTLAQYLEEAANVSSDGIGAIYQQARTIARNNEHVSFRCGRSIDKQIQELNGEQQLQHSELIHHTVITYLRSIMNGPTHLHHCLPRMLTIWLDFAQVVHNALEVDKTSKSPERLALLNNADKSLDRILMAVKSWLKQSPLYYLLTALPQIVSRICHPHLGSYEVLSSMMTSLLVSQYNQQTFWHMVSVIKNRDKHRSSRCQKIFQEAGRNNPDVKSFLHNALDFANKLDELCELKTSNGVKNMSLREKFNQLPALFRRSAFSGSLILPTEKNMLVTLPTVEGKASQHSPFPSGLVYIESVCDEVEVMQSLVKPKKITFRGSDGREYRFLAKAQDDLRRDSRLMDCIQMLNKLFRKDAGARGRKLHIRTYTVVSTSETNGLIEWVDHLKAIRPILLQLHKEAGLNLGSSLTNSFMPAERASVEEKRRSLENCLKAQGGPVFSRWFVNNFSDPQSWLMARMSYVYSTAVISMMGYIIGLGDRHLENINVDTKTGETFHVDMNCLFNKGETMKVPEVVPFRLTHNMVDAFGPLGTEGPFRIACEISLRVMRQEKDLIMSVLRPFVYDPLVDWTKSKAGGEEGPVHLKRVEDRLTGIVTDPLEIKKNRKRKKSLLGHPLSVEGQVIHLIKEATDPDNLAVMYWGWAPYL